MTSWNELFGPDFGRTYAARIAKTAATGVDMHGEATLVGAWLERIGRPLGRVLDAGCGTGRVAIRLAELGHPVVGVDADDSMLSVAREQAPGLDWRLADLVELELADEPPFDLVVCAGNVIPLLAPGTLQPVLDRLTRPLGDGALLVTGFGLDAQHLPPRCPVVPLADYDAAAEAAGLRLVDRFATWGGDPFVDGGGYAVSVHQLGVRSSRPHGDA